MARRRLDRPLVGRLPFPVVVGCACPRLSGRVVLRNASPAVGGVGRPRPGRRPYAPNRGARCCRREPPSLEAAASCSASRRLFRARWGALAGASGYLLQIASTAPGGVGRPRRRRPLPAPPCVARCEGDGGPSPERLCRAPPRVGPVGAVGCPRQRWPRRALHHVACCRRREPPSPETAASCSAWRRPLSAPSAALAGDAASCSAPAVSSRRREPPSPEPAACLAVSRRPPLARWAALAYLGHSAPPMGHGALAPPGGAGGRCDSSDTPAVGPVWSCSGGSAPGCAVAAPPWRRWK